MSAPKAESFNDANFVVAGGTADFRYGGATIDDKDGITTTLVFDNSNCDLWLTSRFTNSIVYYGLSLNAPTIGNNAYVSFAASGAVEWPAYVVNWFLLNRWGRRPTSSSSLFLAGVALLLTMAVPDHKGKWSEPMKCELRRTTLDETKYD